MIKIYIYIYIIENYDNNNNIFPKFFIKFMFLWNVKCHSLNLFFNIYTFVKKKKNKIFIYIIYFIIKPNFN